MKKALKLVWAGWKKVAAIIGRTQTRILLTLFYFMVAGPAWVFMKLFGKDPLNRRTLDNATFWTDHEPANDELAQARRQF